MYPKRTWQRGFALLLSILLLVTALGGCGRRGSQTDRPWRDTTQLSEKTTSRTTYEVFVGEFCDSDGDGAGDLAGVTSKLSYIQDLGCNEIWLMPIMPSQTYHKYDVMDYKAVDKSYGTMEDLEELVRQAHKRGMKITLDFVMNHTAGAHPWFVQACQYLESLEPGQEPDPAVCPYVTYYNFSREQNEKYGHRVGETEWFYEARFWEAMPDLNLNEPRVRNEISEIVDFWLGKGVDGFRLDAAKEYESGDHDENIRILSWFQDLVKEKDPDATIVAEVWEDAPTIARYYSSGVDSFFNFPFATQGGVIARTLNGENGGAREYGEALVSTDQEIRKYCTQYTDAPFYTNHDMDRSAEYYHGEDAKSLCKLAEAMNLLMSGNAYLYYGEELGMAGGGKDENRRLPMAWASSAESHGMCRAPEGADPVTHPYGSLEDQKNDSDSIYSFVKATIALRNRFPALANGTVSLEEGSDEGLCVLRKKYETQEVLLLYNLSAISRTISSKDWEKADGRSWKVAGTLLADGGKVSRNGDSLVLPARSVLVFQ